jgi:hypothetical protein
LLEGDGLLFFLLLKKRDGTQLGKGAEKVDGRGKGMQVWDRLGS